MGSGGSFIDPQSHLLIQVRNAIWEAMDRGLGGVVLLPCRDTGSPPRTSYLSLAVQ